jgi:hypothetical protein
MNVEKYLGNKNEDYPRKNWSSLILWNCGIPGKKDVIFYIAAASLDSNHILEDALGRRSLSSQHHVHRRLSH